MSQVSFKKGSVAVKNLPGSKSRTQLMFLDDLNCAAVDAFEIQPPLELLRQILSQGNISFSRYLFLTGEGVCKEVKSHLCARVLALSSPPLDGAARGQEMIGKKKIQGQGNVREFLFFFNQGKLTFRRKLRI